jgi:hypothetical protein
MGMTVGTAVAQQPGADDVKITVGLKLWHTAWETWLTSGPNVVSTTADKQIAAIPNIAINYKDFFASAGYFVKRNYDFPNGLDVKRNEYDVNLGYWLLRGDAGGRLGLTVGYKWVNQWFDFGPGGNLTDRKKAVTFGFTGSAPIAAGWFLYGNGAYGPWATEKFASTKLDGYYVSAEGGVAYPFAPGATVTLGYKWQTTDFKVGCCGISGDRGRDTTNGFVLGANYTF